MKDYPKILGSAEFDLPEYGEECIAFDKLDGSNLRFEFSPKRGWYKFGTRRRMFDRSDKEYGQAIDMFLAKYGTNLSNVIQQAYPKAESVIAFAEFLGPYSFAGKHDNTWLQQTKCMPEDKNNDAKDLVLFDVNVHKKGFIEPNKFVQLFSQFHIPKILYQGKFTPEFVTDVRIGKYPVVEGAIIKGGSGHNLWMRKVKTATYLDKLKEVFGHQWVDYAE